MTPGKAWIQPSVAGAAIDLLSAVAGGISGVPQHLYFLVKGGDQIHIDIGRDAYHCFDCKTFAIAGKLPRETVKTG